MCDKYGKLEESSNNYFGPMGIFFAELVKQEAIRQGVKLVIIVEEGCEESNCKK